MAFAPPRPAVLNGSVALMCLIWGSTWLVVKEGLADLPPATAVAARFTLSAGLFALLVPRLRHAEGGRSPGFRLAMTQAFFTFGYPYVLLYYTETLLSSGLASVLFSIFPIANAILGQWLLPDQHVPRRAWVGFGIAFAGIGLLFWTDLREIGPDALRVGALYLTAPIASAIGNVLVKKYGSGVSSIVLNRDGLALASILVWSVALLLEGDAPVSWTTTAILSVTYLAVVGTVVTFGIYFWLLRYAPSHKLALIAYVIPAIALAFGAWLGGETVGWTTIGGTSLVLAGIGLVAR